MIAMSSFLDRYRAPENPQRILRRLELALIGALLVAVLQLLWIVFGSLRPAPVKAVPPAANSLQVVQGMTSESVTGPMSLQLQSRPLFWPSRRPDGPVMAIEESSVDGGTPARRLEDLQLVGLIENGSQGTAIVQYKEQRMRLGIGDDLQGWSLLSVANGEAVFVSAGARDIRRLQPQSVAAIREPENPARSEPQAASSKPQPLVGNSPQQKAAVRAGLKRLRALTAEAAPGAEPRLSTGG